MVVHNAAVLTKELVAVNDDIIDDLHPETPGSWTATLQELGPGCGPLLEGLVKR
jgi:hypothetical protein